MVLTPTYDVSVVTPFVVAVSVGANVVPAVWSRTPRPGSCRRRSSSRRRLPSGRNSAGTDLRLHGVRVGGASGQPGVVTSKRCPVHGADGGESWARCAGPRTGSASHSRRSARSTSRASTSNRSRLASVEVGRPSARRRPRSRTGGAGVRRRPRAVGAEGRTRAPQRADRRDASLRCNPDGAAAHGNEQSPTATATTPAAASS